MTQPIESPMVSRSVETAQRRIEGQHFDNRRNLLEYDDVMNPSVKRFTNTDLMCSKPMLKNLRKSA